MSDLAVILASEARRTSLLAVLRSRQALTLDQLDHLINEGAYASELAGLTIAEIGGAVLPKLPPLGIQAGETIEDAVMRVFRGRQNMWLASSFFVRNLKLQRWTAQKVLATLAERGLLERRGTTAATRYRLIHCRRLKRETGELTTSSGPSSRFEGETQWTR